MRIALAGAHATGKSTLAAELARALPGHRVVEEPYYQLEAEGHVFAIPPALDDFEAQLARSLRSIQVERGAVLFDRSPADYLAYMLAHRERDRAAISRWFPAVRAAMTALDLVVFVPIERPDRVAGSEAPRLRRRVDAALRTGIVGDEWGLGGRVLEVCGTPSERTAQVLRFVGGALADSRDAAP